MEHQLHEGGGGTQDAAPKKDLGGFAPEGDFKMVEKVESAEPGNLPEAEAAFRQFGGKSRGTRYSSIVAHSQVPQPKETGNLEDYRGGVIEQNPSKRGGD